MLRLLIGLAGMGLAVPVVGGLALAVVTPVTPSGAGYLAGAVLVVAGLVGVLQWGLRSLLLSLAGLLLVAAVGGARLAEAGRAAAAPLRVVTLPAGDGTRWVNHLVDEQDLLLFGQALLRLVGGVSGREQAGLVPALTAEYAALREVQGSVGSPVLSTYLFWQRPAAFDAVIVEPEGGPPSAGVIFLHGFAGNVSLQCWQVAQPARALGLVTVCPSTGWIGAWWQPAGEATLRTTLDYLRARGIERIYVGGFSNGGLGLGRLAAGLADEADVRGLFFIAGVSEAADLAATGRPVLIIQGAGDERLRAPAARAAAGELGAAATYVELEADHFLIVKEAEAVAEPLRVWLEAGEGGRGMN